EGRGFALSEAKKTDFFSLGMLCLWFIFEKYFWASFPVPMNEDSYGGINEPFAPIAYLKREDSLATFASHLASTEATLLPEQRDSLQYFFSRTLALKPTSRSDSLKKLLERLAEYRHGTSCCFPWVLFFF